MNEQVFCGRCNTWVTNLKEHDESGYCDLIQEVEGLRLINSAGLVERITELEEENDRLQRELNEKLG